MTTREPQKQPPLDITRPFKETNGSSAAATSATTRWKRFPITRKTTTERRRESSPQPNQPTSYTTSWDLTTGSRTGGTNGLPWFKDTLPAAPIRSIDVLRLDGDLYEWTMTPYGRRDLYYDPGDHSPRPLGVGPEHVGSADRGSAPRESWAGESRSEAGAKRRSKASEQLRWNEEPTARSRGQPAPVAAPG
jgi:hypothetical protein